MRINFNPNKDKKIPSIDNFTHRIIIPLHIPNEKGYYKDLWSIFEYCLQSLLKSTHSKTAITVINNGCSKLVIEKLNKLFIQGNIQELIHTGSIGKVNAVLKALRTAEEQLITITDADVLFLANWQNETVKLFNAFPKAGVVGVVPQFKLYRANCYNVLFDKFFSKKLKFTNVLNPEALKLFYKSIGWKNNYFKEYLNSNMTLESKNGVRAIVGAGHFIATYRKEVFKELPKGNTTLALGGNSEHQYFDTPVLRVGGWRLTTEDNYAYHLGNVSEPWMNNTLEELVDESNRKLVSLNKSSLKPNRLSYFIKNHLFRKFISSKSIFRLFLISKGLNKNIADKYING